MYTRYCFSRSNFLIEFIAGVGGAFFCGVPGVVVGSFFGSVYPTLYWGGLTGESAAGMLGLLLASTVGGWLMVYIIGQLIHDHRSGLVSFLGSIASMIVVIFLFDYSYQYWFTALLLFLPVFAAALGYNLPVPMAENLVPADTSAVASTATKNNFFPTVPTNAQARKNWQRTPVTRKRSVRTLSKSKDV
jgi:hypothetical protein